MIINFDIGFDKGLIIAEKLVKTKTGKNLKWLHRAIFKGSWENLENSEICRLCGLSENHIKKEASKLWKLLSEALGEPVSKAYFKAAIERKAQEFPSLLQPRKTEQLIKNGESWTENVQKTQELNISNLDKTELPCGFLPIGSKFYIERPNIDERCFKRILHPSVLLRIKAPHEMGKTSLIKRILHNSKSQGYLSVYLNLESADLEAFNNLDLFFQWFCASISEQLQIPEKVEEIWQSKFGRKRKCVNYFQRYLLPEIQQPVVLAIDELDKIFPYSELANEFFSFLRNCYELSKERDPWKKLRLVIGYSTEEYSLSDINESPFNVGEAIELSELSPSQVLTLADRYGLNWSEKEVQQLTSLIGGHPYLIQTSLSYLKLNSLELNEFLEVAPTEQGLFRTHLRRHMINLKEQPKLIDALKILVDKTEPVPLDFTERFKLYAMGLVHLQKNQVILRCQFYRQYLKDSLATL